MPKLFPLDLMHLIGLNLLDLLLPMWQGLLRSEGLDSVENWDWAVLVEDVWQMHGLEVARTTSYLPGSFDRMPRNPVEKISSGFKA